RCERGREPSRSDRHGVAVRRSARRGPWPSPKDIPYILGGQATVGEGARRTTDSDPQVRAQREPTCDALPVGVSILPDSRAAQELVARHARRTPLLTSRLRSEETGFDVRLKAELFQRTGSYKLRGPLVTLARLSDAERERGVVCSSAGNHAQGVALAAALLGVRAVVVMAEN